MRTLEYESVFMHILFLKRIKSCKTKKKTNDKYLIEFKLKSSCPLKF